MCKFRTLRADEIDVRVGNVSKDGSGFSLLLYKDARVDQNILDETVGCLNWQKRYTRENANCIVSIWDEKKQMWIEKEDVGTESNTESEKGLASDSFKRACVNWGIGRELYTSPFVWVTGYDAKKDRFEVAEIGYDDNRRINKLVVVHSKSQTIVFSMNGTKAQTSAPQKKAEQPMTLLYIDPEMKVKILQQMNRTGVTVQQICDLCKCDSIDNIPRSMFESLMKKLLKTPNKVGA